MSTVEERAARIAAIVAEYLRAVVCGAQPNKDAWAQRHLDLMPELAEELRKASLFRAAYEQSLTPARDDTLLDAAAVSSRDVQQSSLRIRCPHCHVLQEVAGDDAASTLTCAACGSRFSLVEDESVADATRGPRRVAHFALLERMGSGGFGAVWKAHDEQLDRLVALKLPRRGQLSAAEAELFLREARAAAQLHHAGIVSIYEVGRDGESIYIVSELVDGVSLAEWLIDQRMSAREAAELCVKIAEALAHAHQHGVIHRDLKPANVLLDAEGQPHITDFGLARREAGEVTMTIDGQLVGTPAYMSPEQARGDSHTSDVRSDIYALGVILFELLTGELPFRGTTATLLHQVIHDEPPSARRFNTRIPRDLETIALKCLEKDPSRRYATAQVVADDLGRYLRGEPIHARPVGRLERSWRWCRRRPAVAGLTAVLLTVLTAFAIAGPFVAANYKSLATSEASQKQQALAAGRKAERELNLKQHALYATRMNLLQHFWEQGNVSRVTQILDETATDPNRGFEWYYWQRRMHRELRTLRGHRGAIHSLDVAPDGQNLVTGSADGTARLWDLTRGQQLLSLNGHQAAIHAVAFSPDGQRVATGSADQTARIWDVRSGRRQVLLKGHLAGITSLAFSPKGDQLVTGSLDRTAKIWELGSGTVRHTLRGFGAAVSSVDFAPDGRSVLVGSDDHSVTVWDSASGLQMHSLARRGAAISAVAFSVDGQRLLTSYWDQTARVWDATSGQELLTFRGHGLLKDGGINAMAVSPDGKRVATVGNVGQTIKVWDASNARELLKLQGHGGTISSIAFTPDGQCLVTASDDRTVKVWKLEDDGQRYSFEDSGPVVEGGDGVVSTLPLDADFFEGSAFSLDGERLITGSWEAPARLYDLHTGKVLVTLKAGTSCAAFSYDSRKFITGSLDNTATIWDSAGGRELLTLNGHSNRIGAVAFSPDGRLVVTGCWDTKAILWNVAEGRPLRTFSGGAEIDAVAFSPDAKRIVAACGRVARIWDTHSGRETLRLEGHGQGIMSVAFSPDGRQVATGSYDQTAKLWDAASGQEQLTLRGHGPGYQLVAFSPDSRRLATGGWDTTVKLWNTAIGVELLSLTGNTGPIAAVTFSRDGNRVLSSDRVRSVCVCYASTIEEVNQFREELRHTQKVAFAQRQELEGVPQRVESRESAPPSVIHQQRVEAWKSPEPNVINAWLVLMPFAFEEPDGARGLKKPLLPGEADLAPREGDRVSVGPREYTWQAVRLPDGEIDFNKLAGRHSAMSAAYAVTYVSAPTDIPDALLKVGTDDQAMIWLNGEPIYQNYYGRVFQADQDVVAAVQLKAGLNRVVFKVVNQLGDWKGSLRLTDRDGLTLSGLEVTLDPLHRPGP